MNVTELRLRLTTEAASRSKPETPLGVPLTSGFCQPRALWIVRVAIHNARVDLVIAALEFSAVVNIRRAHPEGRCAIRNGRSILHINAVAGRDGIAETKQIAVT